jgi:hypothetical protein
MLCRDLFIVMLNGVILNVIILNVIILNVIILSVVMLSVVALNVNLSLLLSFFNLTLSHKTTRHCLFIRTKFLLSVITFTNFNIKSISNNIGKS